jgi:diguanylate cyclase (GGDEF)-like protein/PAS domain S-box-containing protein
MQALHDAADDEVIEIEYRLHTSDGRWIWCLSRDSIFDRTHEGEVSRFIGTFLDITEKKQAEQALHRSEAKYRLAEEQFRLLLNSAAEGIYGIDTNGLCMFANRACLDMLGYERQEQLIGKNMHDLMHHTRLDGEHNPLEECHIYQAIHVGEGAHITDEVFWRRDGSSFSVEYWSYPMRKNTVVTGAVVTFLDITERKQLESELKHMATHDALTGLYNRKVLERRIAEEIHRTVRYEHELSVFLLDIDYFKNINDTYGHAAGDIVLRNFASLLKKSIRSSDYAARYGGEEFVLVLPETGLSDANELAERLRKEINEQSIQLDVDQVIKVTASIGVATFPDHGSTWEELIDAADAAMYRAKNAGRNQVNIA